VRIANVDLVIVVEIVVDSDGVTIVVVLHAAGVGSIIPGVVIGSLAVVIDHPWARI